MSDDPILPKLIFLVILILINAFFAAAEIAAISLSEAKLKKQAGEGDKKAERLLRLTQAPDHFLAAIQIAVTLAGFLSSAFAADSFSDPLVTWLVEQKGVTALDPRTLNSIMVVLITVALSYFSLVLGELVPKRIAMKKPQAVAQLALGPVCAVAAVFRPAIWLLSKSTNGVLRLLRIDPNAGQEEVSRDEILTMVDLAEEQGTIKPSERELIENVFRFSGTTAGEVMVRCADVLFRNMQSKEIPMAIVVDEYGGTSGLVTIEDLLEVIAGSIDRRVEGTLVSRLESPGENTQD